MAKSCSNYTPPPPHPQKNDTFESFISPRLTGNIRRCNLIGGWVGGWVGGGRWSSETTQCPKRIWSDFLFFLVKGKNKTKQNKMSLLA